jgi:hypothetical protein
MLPLVISFAFLWRAAERLKFDFNFWLGSAFFVGGILLWAWQDRILFRSYRCPSCGMHLPPSTAEVSSEGDPIFYFCQECDVMWDTGLRR